MKNIFNRLERKFEVAIAVDFLGSKLNLSVPVTARSKSEAKTMAKDIVAKKITVVANGVRKVNSK